MVRSKLLTLFIINTLSKLLQINLFIKFISFTFVVLISPFMTNKKYYSPESNCIPSFGWTNKPFTVGAFYIIYYDTN